MGGTHALGDGLVDHLGDRIVERPLASLLLLLSAVGGAHRLLLGHGAPLLAGEHLTLLAVQSILARQRRRAGRCFFVVTLDDLCGGAARNMAR